MLITAAVMAKVTKGLLRGPVEGPLRIVSILTESRDFDTMHRRAGGNARPLKGGPYGHGDAHKYCQGYSCGTRPRPKFPFADTKSFRSQKITAWRKTKARANRAYLEEKVYAKTKHLG